VVVVELVRLELKLLVEHLADQVAAQVETVMAH
jgi:hypothetical protein